MTDMARAIVYMKDMILLFTDFTSVCSWKFYFKYDSFSYSNFRMIAGPLLGFSTDGWQHQEFAKAKNQKVICTSFYCNSRLLGLNLTGGCHPLPEIDGWPATRATRSNEGPVLTMKNIMNCFIFKLIINPFFL